MHGTHAPGERRPTGTRLRIATKPALWAVRSTGWLDLMRLDTELRMTDNYGGKRFVQHGLPCPEAWMTICPPSATWMWRSCPSSSDMPTSGAVSTASASTYRG